jgi:hypothetical protein
MRTYAENEFTASVGKYGRNGRPCYNVIKDQEMVQSMLNRIPTEYGGADGRLHTPPQWGRTSPELQEAIERFQKMHAIDEELFTDGHIDPHDRTIRALLKYAYHRLYQWADDTPPPTHKEILPTSGVRVTDRWELVVSEEYSDTGINLDNGVRLGMPAREKGGWPKERTLIKVTRIIDKDGKIEYDVFLQETRLLPGAAVHASTEFIEEHGSEHLAGAAAKGLLRSVLPETLPRLGMASEGAAMVLIPTTMGDVKTFDNITWEGPVGSVLARVHVVVNF